MTVYLTRVINTSFINNEKEREREKNSTRALTAQWRSGGKEFLKRLSSKIDVIAIVVNFFIE